MNGVMSRWNIYRHMTFYLILGLDTYCTFCASELLLSERQRLAACLPLRCTAGPVEYLYKYCVVCCSGFEISEYQKRQAAMTVRKVTKQKGEATRRYQVISHFFSSLACSVFSSLFTLPSTCFLLYFLHCLFKTCIAFFFMEGRRLAV